ncbi:hypothetical protein C8R45DRAFT_929867 [Mycena sanguinolenta]|nr:hypothetical protein C8R45DRAFT_929867 [Mycena sanguinolenta]
MCRRALQSDTVASQIFKSRRRENKDAVNQINAEANTSLETNFPTCRVIHATSRRSHRKNAALNPQSNSGPYGALSRPQVGRERRCGVSDGTSSRASDPVTVAQTPRTARITLKTTSWNQIEAASKQELSPYFAPDTYGKHTSSSASSKPMIPRLWQLPALGNLSVLVNTYGSGKTRLAFEGLCHNWGFYFTALNLMVSDLGSRDIIGVVDALSYSGPSFVKEVIPSASSARILEHNHSITEQRLGRTLLVRLLIFRMFLDIAREGGLAVEHKMKWLMLQLRPTLSIFGDIFETLIDGLHDYDEQDISDALNGIRQHLGSDFHLFLVLDEGQEAASCFPQAFHTDPGEIPFLIKILNTWDKHIPRGWFSCVIAGTDIPVHIFESSKYAKHVRWTSDTGPFDDQALHESYLRRFSPPRFWRRSWGRNSSRGHGRGLAEGQPNNVLDRHITTATRFRPTDGAKWTELERSTHQPIPQFPDLHTHAFSWLYEPHHSGNPSKYHLPLSGLRPTSPLVSGHDADGVSGFWADVACDEPIALIGIAAWMTRKPPVDAGILGKDAEYNYLTSLQISPPPTAKAFGACLAFYFSRAFDSKFPVPVPAWAKRPATLVELHTAADEVRYSVTPDTGIVAPLATSATSIEEVVSWMEHSTRTPFCIPDTEGSDLHFVLKLANGAYIWVIMRVDPTTSDGSDLLNLIPQEYDDDSALRKRVVELLNMSPTQANMSTRTSTTPTVLCVVAAFENQIVLPDHPEKGSPAVASLSLDTFHKLTAAQPLSAFVETVAANILKRKREALDDETERQASMPIEEEERGVTKKAKRTKKAEALDDETERQHSMPIEEEERRVTKKPKRTKKAPKSEAPRAPKAKPTPTSQLPAASTSRYNLRPPCPLPPLTIFGNGGQRPRRPPKGRKQGVGRSRTPIHCDPFSSLQ